MKTLLLFLLVAVVLAGLVVGIPVGLQRQQQFECNKWKNWEKQDLGDFTISDKMRHDCLAVGVVL